MFKKGLNKVVFKNYTLIQIRESQIIFQNEINFNKNFFFVNNKLQIYFA